MKINSSDIIAILAILVNVGLSIYIVQSIQSKLSNKRSLKDYFINEVKEIKNEFSSKLNDLSKEKVEIKELIPWFKEMNQRCSELDDILKDQYSISETSLKDYPIELRIVVTESEDFEQQFRNTGNLKISIKLEQRIREFRSSKKSIFHKKIIEINNQS